MSNTFQGEDIFWRDWILHRAMISLLFNLYIYFENYTSNVFFFSFLTSCFCSVWSNVFYCVTKCGYTLHFFPFSSWCSKLWKSQHTVYVCKVTSCRQRSFTLGFSCRQQQTTVILLHLSSAESIIRPGLTETDLPVSSWLHPMTDHDCLAMLMHRHWAQHRHHYFCSHKEAQALFCFHSLSFTRKHTEKHNNRRLWIQFSGRRCCWTPWTPAGTLRDVGKRLSDVERNLGKTATLTSCTMKDWI